VRRERWITETLGSEDAKIKPETQHGFDSIGGPQRQHMCMVYKAKTEN
jgi:hypothetical protein